MKKHISPINVINSLVYIIIAGSVIYGKMLSYKGYDAFLTLTIEDGPVEYLTAFFLLAGSIMFSIKAIRALKEKNYRKMTANLVYCLVFFFGTGEEISWGQRIFNIQSGEYFLEKNAQAEINFHNLTIAGIDINKLVFSNLMFVVILFYFIFLKQLIRWSGFIKRMVVSFDLPVPRYHHIVFLLVSALLIVNIHMRRESELYEMALSGILFLVFLHPAIIKTE